MSQIDRRTFVTAAAAACAACALGLKPALAVKTPSKPVDCGELANFDEDGFHMAFARTFGFILIRANDKMIAVSSQCTHQATRLRKDRKNKNLLRCPNHGSKFDTEGVPTEEPATEPLIRYGIFVKDGRLYVNLRKMFAKENWGKEEAFVSLKKD